MLVSNSVFLITDKDTDMNFLVKFVNGMKISKITTAVERIIWNGWLDDEVPAKFILIQPDAEQCIKT